MLVTNSTARVVGADCSQCHNPTGDDVGNLKVCNTVHARCKMCDYLYCGVCAARIWPVCILWHASQAVRAAYSDHLPGIVALDAFVARYPDYFN